MTLAGLVAKNRSKHRLAHVELVANGSNVFWLKLGLGRNVKSPQCNFFCPVRASASPWAAETKAGPLNSISLSAARISDLVRSFPEGVSFFTGEVFLLALSIDHHEVNGFLFRDMEDTYPVLCCFCQCLRWENPCVLFEKPPVPRIRSPCSG